MFLRSFLCFAVGCQVMFLGLGGALRSAEALDCSGTEVWKWVGYHAGKELLLVHQTVEADAENHCPTIHIAEWSLRRNEFVAKHPIVTR